MGQRSWRIFCYVIWVNGLMGILLGENFVRKAVNVNFDDVSANQELEIIAILHSIQDPSG